MKVIVSKKLMKFLPVSYDLTSKVGALITGDCRKCILTIFFFIVRLLTPHPGKASSYQIKVRLFRDRSHWNTNSTSTVSLEPTHFLPHFSVLIQVMRISFTCCIRMVLHKSLGLPLMVAKQLTQLSTIHLQKFNFSGTSVFTGWEHIFWKPSSILSLISHCLKPHHIPNCSLKNSWQRV